MAKAIGDGPWPQVARGLMDRLERNKLGITADSQTEAADPIDPQEVQHAVRSHNYALVLVLKDSLARRDQVLGLHERCKAVEARAHELEALAQQTDRARLLEEIEEARRLVEDLVWYRTMARRSLGLAVGVCIAFWLVAGGVGIAVVGRWLLG